MYFIQNICIAFYFNRDLIRVTIIKIFNNADDKIDDVSEVEESAA